MGIAFTGMRPADFEKLQRLAPAPTKPVAAPRVAARTVASSAQPQPRPPAPRPTEAADIPATPEAFQAIVRLLIRKGLLTRAEVMDELEKLKPTRA